MFRRTSKTETAPAAPATGTTVPARPGAKGRPTPSRKEAEAAARERARAVPDKKAAQKVLRERRLENNAKVREAMRTGDDRYLPARDKGPVKRFLRDFVDSRISVAEFLLPVLLVLMFLQYSRIGSAVTIAVYAFQVVLLVVVVDTVWLVVRSKRALRERFPDEDLSRTTTYTVLRSTQMRFLRQPKPQVKLGGARRQRS